MIDIDTLRYDGIQRQLTNIIHSRNMDEDEHDMRLDWINLSSYERYTEFVSELSYESSNEEIDFEGKESCIMYVLMFACVCVFDCLFVLLTCLPAFTGDVYRTLDLRKCLASHCRLESLHILTSTFTNLTRLTASFNRLTGEVFFHFTSTLFSLTQNIYCQTQKQYQT